MLSCTSAPSAAAPAQLRARAFGWAIAALILLAVGWSLWELVHRRWAEGAALAGIAMLGAASLWIRDRLPSAFGFLLTLAALVNAGGYVLTLWHQESSFDEAAHVFTTFALMAAAGWAVISLSSLAASRRLLFATILAAGFILGAAWELVEWGIGIIGSRRDTMIDLAMDAAGAIAAGAVTVWLAGARR